ncbi:MAG: NAD(P)H-hydrate epimerase [Christensenellales bacterium]
MNHIISPQDMREMERAFLEGTGYPSILLMEHAAQAVIAALREMAPSKAAFAASGQQRRRRMRGGKALDAAGRQAEFRPLKSPSQMKGDAGVNACLLNSCGAALNVLYNEAPEIPADCAAVVDALYGTG